MTGFRDGFPSQRDSMAAAALQLAIPLLVVAYAITIAPLTTGPIGGPVRIGESETAGLLGADVAVALGLLAAGVTSWLGAASMRVGLLAILSGAAWLGPYLVVQPTIPTVLRLVGVGAAPFLLPVVVHLVIAAADRSRASSTTRRGLAVLYGLCLILAVASVATYDPFFELDCTASCAHVPAFVEIGSAGRILLQELLAGFNVAAALALTLVAARGLIVRARSRNGRRMVLAGGLVIGPASAGLGVLSLVRVAQLGDPLGRSRDEAVGALLLGLDVGALVLAAGLIWAVVDALRQRVRLRRVADDMEAAPAPGTLQLVLGEALGDTSLDVGYWAADSERYVGADGGPFDVAASSERALTTIERAGDPLAIVRHRRDLESAAITREIGPRMRVALDNERLRAVSLAHLAELRASRNRVVETGDGERRQIERNLHDGAQQRLLAISFELRLARLSADRAGVAARSAELTTAEGLAASAIDELRRLAGGIHPAVLSQAGLVPALASLAEDSSIAVEVRSDLADRVPPTVESSAYRIVTEALADALRRGASGLVVQVGRGAGSAVVEISDDGEPPPCPPIRLVDRVGAAGGDLEIVRGPGGTGTSLRVVLPCA